MTDNIPLLDLKAQLNEIRSEIKQAVNEVIESGRYILGPNVAAFEKETADYCGAKFAIGVASGTDALLLALKAVGVGHGDEVITTPFTFIATAEAISHSGAKPVFADIDPRTFNIDVAQIEAKITEKTKAIIPVHLYGQPAEMDDMTKIAKQYGLKVVEDCAQSIGSKYVDKMTGMIGDAGAFSFFPSKNLGGYGDGGMVVTDDENVAERIRALRAHGSRQKYRHEVIGYNSRLDEIQAAILRIKLRRLDGWNAARQNNAALYDRLLAGTEGLQIPFKSDRATHVYHLYTIRISFGREKLQSELAAEGIASAVHYPIPIHLQDAYAHLGIPAGSLPQSEKAAAEVLSLPLYPELTEDQVKRAAAVVRRFLSST